MATIYRFLIESKGDTTKKGGVGSARSTKAETKKGKGGVEFSRYQRVTTTIGNRLTGGMYSKGLRVGKSLTHLVYKNQETGKLAVSGVAIVILIQAILRGISAWRNWEEQQATIYNAQNYKKMEVGKTQISRSYKVSTNAWNGRVNYKENK